MSNFVYAPGVRVYISTAKHGIIDVSDDLSSGTMVRRSDGVSTFDFTINNPRRIYDNVFTPNDRIIVTMRRVQWVRTFTGLLNSVPLFSAWPSQVNIRSSCSLKRLQYYFWDPYAMDSQTLLLSSYSAAALGRAPSAAHGVADTDFTISNVVLSVLEKVVGWPSSKVHIAKIPENWYGVCMKIAQEVANSTNAADAAAQQFLDQMGAKSSAGLTTDVSGSIQGDGRVKPGKYANVVLSAEQANNASIILQTAQKMKISAHGGVLGIMCAMQESTLRNLAGGDRDSVGLFQQRPSQGWGTVAQCRNPSYAAGKFFAALKKVTGWSSMPATVAIQAVQRSGFPGAYAKWEPMATAVVQRANKVTTSNVAGISATEGVVPATGADSGGQDGTKIATLAVQLVSKYKIGYSQSTPRTMSYATRLPPPMQDCSLFAAQIYWQVMGKKCWSGGPVVSTIDDWCMSHGGKRISAADGLNTPGAFMIITAEHMGISVGDGSHVVQSRRPGTYAASLPTPASMWSYAVLAPGTSYKKYGTAPVVGPGGSDNTDTNGVTSLAGVVDMVPFDQTSWYNSNDPIDKLFGRSMWQPSVDADQVAFANSLVGVRALLNDVPILPWVSNMMNSAMRSISSAPNGDLIAWFPDYYGYWGQAAIMKVEPIELLDFTVDWSDDSMVTHMFTTVSQPGMAIMDASTGEWADEGLYPQGPGSALAMRAFMTGVANIDMPSMLDALFGISSTTQAAEDFAQFVYKRFGARPAFEEVPGLSGPSAEFFSAVFKFMLYWSYQYNADIPMTFMPELWPGMLLQIPKFSFQAYVTTVTHSFDMADGGGFYTTVNVAAPARLDDRQGGIFLGLPMAGGFTGRDRGHSVLPSIPGRRN